MSKLITIILQDTEYKHIEQSIKSIPANISVELYIQDLITHIINIDQLDTKQQYLN